jgi:hypothetical protein
MPPAPLPPANLFNPLRRRLTKRNAAFHRWIR